jgi:fibronectin-binding autotransporter adhesin
MDVATSTPNMSIPTSTLRTSLLHAALFTVTAASAAEIQFNTNALTTSEVTTSSNWVGNVAPGAGDIAAWMTDVDAVTAGNQESRAGVLTIASPVSWLGLRHQDSNGPLTLTGAPITLGASGITEVVWETLTIQNNVVLAANQTWTNSVAATASGSISGAFGLTKAGTSTLTLSGENNYSGPTTVGNGTLSVSSINSVSGGGGSALLTGSSLGAPTTVADGTISLGAGGTQGILNYTGAGETTNRVINLSGAAGGATISLDSTGLLNFTSATTATGSGAKGVTLTGGGSGQIPGFQSNGGLTNLSKAGAGTWTLTGASSQTAGAVNVNGGILSYTGTASRTTGTFTRNVTGGGVLKIASGSNVVTSTGNTNGILGGWATVDNTTWAVANGASAVTGLASFTNDTWAAGTNTDVTSAIADPAAASTTHSVRFNTAGAKTLTLAGANRVTSGGILVTSAVGANETTISGGSVSRNAASDLVFHQHNTAGGLTLGTLISDDTPASRTGGTTSGTKIITGLSSTSDLTVGMAVTGTGIAGSSTIATIDSATQITLNNNTTATGTPTLSFRFVTTLTKTGAGTMTLNGAQNYTGTTHVHDGELVVNGNSGGKTYTLSQPATLKLGYGTGNSVTGYGVTIHGNGTSATTGLYLTGGNIYYFHSGLSLQTAPTRVRAQGTGTPTLAGWDTNVTHLTVGALASGSVIDSAINFTTSTYGYVMNIAAGKNTATGDITFEGPLASTSGGSAHYRKIGAGSLTLSGAGTNTAPVDIREGRVILTGGDDRIGTGSAVYLGNGASSGKLILNGISQRLANLTTVGTGTANAVVGGSATGSTLTVNYNGTGQTFPGTIGGTGIDENNLAFGKSGTGTYTLTGANTYTGGTTLTDGILALGSAGALGTTGTISLGGGTLQFSAANTTDYSSRIRLEDGTTSTIDTNGQIVTFASALQTGTTGDGGLTKAGAGTLGLGGSNTYTGLTPVSAGTLRLDYTASNTSKIADNAPLKLSGGNIELVGGSHVELVGDTELTTSGTATITRTSGSAVLNLGYITRNGVGTIDFAAPGIARTSLVNDGSGKLPAWITVAGQPAARDVSGNVIAYAGFADVVRLGGKIPNNVNANVRIINGGTSGNITALNSGLSDIATLLQNATAGPAVIDLGGSNTLRLGYEGAVLVPATSGALTIQQGQLTAGGGDEIPGEIAVDADGELIIDAAIENNGAGAVIVSKTGSGSLTLSQSNAYTGGTLLTQGQLRVNHAEALGLDAPLTIAGGTLDNTSGAAIEVTDTIPQFWDADVSFAGTNNLRFTAGTATLTDHRAVNVTAGELGLATVAGGYNLAKNGAGTLSIATHGITATTTVNAGVLEVQGRINNDAPYVVTPTGTLRIGYTTGGAYANTNLKLHGAGLAATTGLYLEGGTTYNTSGNMELLTAPTTIRQFGTGLAGIGIFDINAAGLIVSTAASGSVIDSNVEFISRGYGMSVDIATGANTATGDLVMNGQLNAATLGLYKRGAGSLLLNAAATTGNVGVKLQAGSVITGVDNALGENAELPISSGAKLVLNGHSQAAATLSGAGQVINGSATPAALTIKQGSDQTFSGVLGGAGANDANFSLVKTGASKLTLSGANNYNGSTTVNAGTLAVTTAFFADGSDVILSAIGALELATAGTDVIDQLVVDGAAQSPGIYGAVGSGAQFERSYITGTGKLSVTTGATGDYDSWEVDNNIDGAGAGTDSDADGIDNGIEFVIGGDPSGPNSDSRALMPAVTTDATYINFVFRRTDAAAAYNPYVQYGSTLNGSTPTGWTEAQPGVNGVLISEDNDFYGTGTDRVTVQIPRNLAEGGKLFAQLRIDIP